MATIETLGEIRAEYNFWNEKERPYYEALSEAIRVLNAQKDKFHYAKIVRCGECKYFHPNQKAWTPNGFVEANWCKRHGYHFCDADWFCADGEKMEVQYES